MKASYIGKIICSRALSAAEAKRLNTIFDAVVTDAGAKDIAIWHYRDDDMDLVLRKAAKELTEHKIAAKGEISFRSEENVGMFTYQNGLVTKYEAKCLCEFTDAELENELRNRTKSVALVS